MSAREPKVRKDSQLFAEMCAELMRRGHQVQFRADGKSMSPNLDDGDELLVAPVPRKQLKSGDIALVENLEGLRAHRVISSEVINRRFATKSDTAIAPDFPAVRVYGKVIARKREGRSQTITPLQVHVMHPAKVAIRRVRKAVQLRLRRAAMMLFGIVAMLVLSGWLAPLAFAQADLTMTQTAPATIPTGINFTYTETVKNNGPNSVPANTLVVYQQTPANTTYRSIAATNWTCTTPGAGNSGPIVCTFNNALASGATANTITITERVTAGTATGTNIQNSATVTSQTADPTPSNNTTVTSVLVEPTGSSDMTVSLTAAPTPVFVSSNLIYTAQVTNLGPSNAAATTNILKVTLPAGVTFVSTSQPAGWTCTGTGPVNCNSPALTAGTTATISVTVTAPATAATLTASASVNYATDSNSTNNNASVVTVVQPLVCATPGRDGIGGTLTGVVNTYFAPSSTGTLAAGSTSVALGTGTGATTPIAAGDLLLIIQMQDATINSTNSGAYGDGTAGDPATGSTAVASSGLFEFVTATNAVPIGGGTLQFTGTGPTNGLLNSYAQNAATGTAGQQTYQVIRVPQYSSATLSSGLVPLRWNGSVGGVLVLDVASQLTLGGTVSLDGMGFRGGGGRILTGGTGANTDYVTLATNAANASKGEGIAGTPRYLAPTTIALTTTATDTGLEGLPSGSFSRGAPGNAGGGGTDGDPPANDENSGGGGGGNGGSGGLGGYGWNTFTALNSTNGGFGGAAFSATTSALVMGGGGGAGTTNNGSYYNSGTDHNANCGANCTGIYSSGSAGGGIVIIHAGSVSGSGTISANGLSTLNTDNDSTGGAGAGGSVEVYANSGSLTGLTVSAAGGSAGNAWPEQAPTAFSGNRHGPGGGGGGGVVILTSSAGGVDISSGDNGYTNTAQDSYGATPGTAGTSSTAHIITETPGTQAGAYCAGADLDVTNSGAPTVVVAGGTITYTQTVINNGPLDAVNAIFSEAIPANTTFSSIVPLAGWTCSTPAVGGTGNIICTNPVVGSGTNGTFTVVVTVAPGTVTGTQIVDVDNITSGTNDPNLANNTATAINTVGAATSADLILTNTSSSPTTLAGTNVTMTAVVKNQGPAAAANLTFSENLPTDPTGTIGYTSFVSLATPPGWFCNLPAIGASTGTIFCTATSMAAGATSTFPVVLKVLAADPAGTVVNDTATVASATPDSNPTNNVATATTIVGTANQADLAVSSSAAPNPISPLNTITYTQSVTNNGPTTVTNALTTSVAFTDTIPVNTVLAQAFVAPTGWTCNSIAVGGTGTFSCTLNAGQTIVSGASVNFPLVVKVNAGTAPGTTITNTAAVNTPCSATQDPNCSNNSVTTNVIVASPTQTDVSIVKTASPEPVNQGTNLTYSLKVTNAGPAIAQGVTVTDVLPAQVAYSSSSSTQGTCTYTAATTTVSCSVGNMSVGSVVIVTINVTANTFSSASTSTNTATVSATTGDPNSGNNSSTFVSTIQAPTAVDLASFDVYRQPDGTALLEWSTHEESRNLGFHIYRENSSGRQRVNPSIIAGSALLLRGSKPQHAAKQYAWIDTQPVLNAGYWIEDLDINGTRTLHGPYYAKDAPAEQAATRRVGPMPRAALLNSLQARTAELSVSANPRLHVPRPILPIIPVGTPRLALADHNAVKIGVEQEGWYHVTFAQLYAAGLDTSSDPRSLHLYAEGVEQPLLITGRPAGPVAPNDAIEFYGTGIDTPFSGTRMYWLVRDNTYAKRITTASSPIGGNAPASGFPFTVIREDRTTYFAALLNGENNDNFFGAVLTSDPTDQDLLATNIDANSDLPVTLDVTLQGVTDQQEHSLSVQFNGSSIGQMSFMNDVLAKQSFPLDRSLLKDGTNTVTLTALNGDNDVSMVQSIELNYGHTYTADGNWLRATTTSGAQLNIGGFTNPQIRAFDITDPLNIVELQGSVALSSAACAIRVIVPHGGPATRTILAFSNDVVSAPVSLAKHVPSYLDDRRVGADYVVIANPEFVQSLTPLLQLREAQGHRVSLVTTDQIYDEYNFGEHSPFALRSFLQDAASKWQRKPQSVLLVGRASLDPRNYLGFGELDFVPSRMIETAAFKTASDDWLTDFQQNGYATVPTGRLPVGTTAEADLVVSKIVNYEKGTYAGAWNNQAVVISDQNVDVDFTSAAIAVTADLPSTLQVNKILANNLDYNTARNNLLTALNSGALLVNYSGHGSEQQWSFTDLFDTNDATALSNGGRLPVYLVMDCLNGFFQDVYEESLAQSLLLAPNGGAVAVWASSGFTNQPPQATMNLALLNQMRSFPSEPLGKLVMFAKSGTTDNDVRRTWILFGDPAMKLQFSPAALNGSGSSVAPSTPVQPPLRVNTPRPFLQNCVRGSNCQAARKIQ